MKLAQMEQIAAALELPNGADIVEYASHVKALCTARGQLLAAYHQQMGPCENTRFSVPAGTIAHICGIPVRIARHADVDTNPRNWALITRELESREPSTPTCGEHTIQVERP